MWSTSRASSWAALGASGGRRIMPPVAQMLSFLVDWGMTLEETFHQPRLDVSGEGRAILACLRQSSERSRP